MELILKGKAKDIKQLERELKTRCKRNNISLRTKKPFIKAEVKKVVKKPTKK